VSRSEMTWALCTVPNGVNNPCRSEEVAEEVKFPTCSFFPTRSPIFVTTLTCLFRTQFQPCEPRFSLIFSHFQALDLGAI
jgi:hypothetical protein